MKTRNGFVSNSSSSSFILKKENLTPKQINILENFHELAEMFSETFGNPQLWKVHVGNKKIQGSCLAEGFNMLYFLSMIGIPSTEYMYSTIEKQVDISHIFKNKIIR